MRLELHETGQSAGRRHLGGRRRTSGSASRSATRGRSALHAQISVDEEPPVDVAEGDEIEIAGSRWRVVQIVEDPAHQRGDVFLERTQE